MFQNGVALSSAMPSIDGRVSVPVADITSDSPFSPEEIRFRNRLASLYRVVDLFKWTQLIYNHLTVRLPSEESDQILINPFGLLYHEITAASLEKVDLNGKVLHAGTTKLGINQAGFVLHSAIHAARRDVTAVLHLHVPSVAAVSSMKCGLLPICQEAMIVGPVAYHDYQGILVDMEEKAALARNLGEKNVMLLRNHGFIVCGSTIEEAFYRMYNLILACETQVKAMSCGGVDHLILPNSEAVQRAFTTSNKGAGGVNRQENGSVDTKKWGFGELEWQALMRTLDGMGLKTGHEYR